MSLIAPCCSCSDNPSHVGMSYRLCTWPR